MHPEGALAYFEVPDVPALRSAYDSAPLLRLLEDPQVSRFAASVAKEAPEHFDLHEAFARRIEAGLGQLDPKLSACIRSLEGLRAVSLSISGAPPEASSPTAGDERTITLEAGLSSLGALLVLTLSSPEEAARVQDLWLDLLARGAGEGGAAENHSDSRAHYVPAGPYASVWMLVEGPRLFVGSGSDRPEELEARLRGEAAALGSDERFRGDRARFSQSEGATVYEAHLRIHGLGRALFGGDLPLPAEARRQLAALGSVLLPGDDYESHRRARLVGGRFVTEAFVRVDPDASKSLFGAFGAAPVPRDALLAIPADAVAGWATSLDSERLARDLGALVSEATGEPLEQAMASVRERFGFDPVADLVGSLGGRASFYCLPISGLTLPKVHLVLDLRDPAAFERGLKGLGRVLGEASGGEIEVGARPYRNLPLYSFAPRRNLGEIAGGYGAPQQVVSLLPSFVSPELAVTVMDGRAVFGIGRIALKHEMKRLLDEKESSLAPVLAAKGAFPDDATSISFVDWGRILGGIYDSARRFLPILGPLPFDLDQLPDPALFTKHFAPSVSWTRHVPGGEESMTRSAFGPEVGVALGLGVSLFAGSRSNSEIAIGASEVEEHPIEDPPAPAEDLGPPPQEDPASRTRKTLRDVKLALVVYKTDRGRYPDELDRLFEATERFPQGFLEGAAPVVDGWNRALRYRALEQGASFRAWSVGPDGVDEEGGGDDLPIE